MHRGCKHELLIHRILLTESKHHQLYSSLHLLNHPFEITSTPQRHPHVTSIAFSASGSHVIHQLQVIIMIIIICQFAVCPIAEMSGMCVVYIPLQYGVSKKRVKRKRMSWRIANHRCLVTHTPTHHHVHLSACVTCNVVLFFFSSRDPLFSLTR